MSDVEQVLAGARVVPVVVLQDADRAVDLAQALLAGGIGVMELTLRTPSALLSLQRISEQIPQMVMGAGTVLSGELARRAIDAGARFLVSPGMTAPLLEELLALDTALLPGVATASEAMHLHHLGLEVVKFFPAEPAGGISYLRALAAPLPQVRFCPTGGIEATTAGGYLALPNVSCVGGSWLTPQAAVAAGDWERIRDLAACAAQL